MGHRVCCSPVLSPTSLWPLARVPSASCGLFPVSWPHQPSFQSDLCNQNTTNGRARVTGIYSPSYGGWEGTGPRTARLLSWGPVAQESASPGPWGRRAAGPQRAFPLQPCPPPAGLAARPPGCSSRRWPGVLRSFQHLFCHILSSSTFLERPACGSGVGCALAGAGPTTLCGAGLAVSEQPGPQPAGHPPAVLLEFPASFSFPLPPVRQKRFLIARCGVPFRILLFLLKCFLWGGAWASASAEAWEAACPGLWGGSAIHRQKVWPREGGAPGPP